MTKITKPNLSSVADMRQWVRKNWHKTMLNNSDKEILLTEIFREIVTESPLVTPRSVRQFLLNDNQKLWQQYHKQGRLKYTKPYLERWSFNKLCWFVLNKFIKIAMQFDIPESKSYISYYTHISEALFNEIKKMQTGSLSALFDEMVSDFQSLPIDEQRRLLRDAKLLLANSN